THPVDSNYELGVPCRDCVRGNKINRWSWDWRGDRGNYRGRSGVPFSVTGTISRMRRTFTFSATLIHLLILIPGSTRRDCLSRIKTWMVLFNVTNHINHIKD